MIQVSSSRLFVYMLICLYVLYLLYHLYGFERINEWTELNCILSVLVLLTTRRSSQMIAAYLQLVIANCQEFHSKLQKASNLRIIRYFKRWIDGQCCLQIEGSQFWNKKEIIHFLFSIYLYLHVYIHRTLVSILYKHILNIHASFLLNLRLPDLTWVFLHSVFLSFFAIHPRTSAIFQEVLWRHGPLACDVDGDLVISERDEV